MALTQMQIIQSLGEAMTWFERELHWGVQPTELRHLVGRIGELYAALITNGQMATKVNQRGYDVVSGDGEKISVKTTAMMGAGGHIALNPNTFDKVDRVIILRVNTEEMQIEQLLNAPVAQVRELMVSENQHGRYVIPLARLVHMPKPVSALRVVRDARCDNYNIRELENGAIEVYVNNELAPAARPELINLASVLKVSTLNVNGNPYNTRQLGNIIITAIKGMQTECITSSG